MTTPLADEFLLHYSSQSQWHQPQLKIAQEYRQQKKVHDSKNPYSFWCNIDDFQRYGPGIFLYFKFIKVFMIGMLIVGLLSLPTLISNILGGGLNSFGGGWNKSLMKTTLANQQYYDWSRLNTEASLQKDLNFSKFLIKWNDIICSIVFMFIVFYWKISAARLTKSSITHRILPSSYTILVSNLPLTYNELGLKQHFQKFGEVVQISPVKNISTLKIEADKIQILVNKILTQRKNNTKRNEAWERVQLQMYLNVFLSCYESYKFSKVRSTIISFNLPKVRSYVSDIYKYKIGSEDVMNYNNTQIKVSKFKKEPINIIWQNFHLNRNEQIKKSLLLGLIIFSIMIIGLILLFLIRVSGFVQLPILTGQQFTYQKVIQMKDQLVTNTFCYNLNYKSFKDQYFQLCKQFLSSYSTKLLKNVQFSLMLIFLNWTLNQLIQVLIKFRKYPTVSEKNRFTILCLFVFMFFTNCILTLLVQGEVGNLSIRGLLGKLLSTDKIKQIVVYKQFSRKWFLDIGSQIIVNNIITLIICPPIGIINEKIFKMIRYFTASRAKFQKQMNQALLDPIFDINFYYAQLLTTIFFCLMYSSSMPILYFLVPISLLVIYCSSKLMFIRYTRQPYLLDHSLDTLISRLIPLAALLHQVMGFIFFSVQQFFPSPLITTNTFDHTILLLQQGFPFIMTFVILLVYLIYQKQIDRFLVRSLIQVNDSDQKPLKQILKLQSKYLYSYRIQDNPDYFNLLKMIKILEQIEKTRIKQQINDDITTARKAVPEYSSTERTLVR